MLLRSFCRTFLHSSFDFDVVAGILTLALKYDVKFLWKHALLHLEDTFPDTLIQWDERSEKGMVVTPVMLIKALRLARSLDLERLLPSIYYACATLPLQTILEGVECNHTHFGFDEVDKQMLLFSRAKLQTKLQGNLHALLLARYRDSYAGDFLKDWNEFISNVHSCGECELLSHLSALGRFPGGESS